MTSPSILHRIFAFLDRYRGVVALAIVFIWGCYVTRQSGAPPVFLQKDTQFDILYERVDYGLLATGMTLVILIGGIDLSVSSVLGLCATLFSLLMIGYGWSWPSAMAATVAAGAACGSLNGVLIARLGLQPFVATLATMVAARGAAKWICGGMKVQPGAQPWFKLQGDSPGFYRWMTTPMPTIGLQPATILFILGIIVMAVIVHRTKFGRTLFAVGGNEEATRLAGIHVSRIKIATYAICGAFAAAAGIVNACRNDLGDPEAGAGYELDAIAAVVIGGTSLAGGRGGMILTLIGVVIMGYINKVLSLRAVDIAPRMVIQASIIIIAVLIQRQRRSSK